MRSDISKDLHFRTSLMGSSRGNEAVEGPLSTHIFCFEKPRLPEPKGISYAVILSTKYPKEVHRNL